MNPKQLFYEKQAATVIRHLEKRKMKGFYCPTKEDAVAVAMSLTAPDTTVCFGGSASLLESGVMDALKARTDITLIDRGNAKTPEEIQQAYRHAFLADSYFMSTNAITIDGHLVNIDGNGNRVAALIYGPNQVIIVAGMNKIVPTVEDAVRRVRNTATPPNCIRLNLDTPCAATGACADCLSEHCICSQIVITRRSRSADRIKVLLVGEELGF